MRRALLACSALALTAAALSAAPAAHGQTADSCIKSWPEVRYGALAYNHVVHIADSCEVGADCVVTTDVSPQPQRVAVEAKSEVEVMTFLGSPARTFKPNVKCVMRK